MRFIYTRTFWYIMGCLVAAVILLAAQNAGWLEPLQYALVQTSRPFVAIGKAIGSPVSNLASTIGGVRGLMSENGRLRNQVQDLQQKLVAQDALQRENTLLLKELDFQKTASYKTQPCTVLANESSIVNTAIINCASAQGVKVGQAVLSQGHLVGKILYVGNLSSTVQLLPNAQSAVDVRVNGSDTTGVVRGSFGSGLLLDLVPQQANLQPGDLLVTAGINSEIPKNILIGEVSQITSQANQLFKQAVVTSPVDFRDLPYVFVAEP